MSETLNKASITSGYWKISNGREFDRFFPIPEVQDRIIIQDGEVEETVDLMKRVVWKYLDDTKRIAPYLKGNTLQETCRKIWYFLFNHIQYKLDKRGLEQLRRPARSWAERQTGIDCDCFSIFVSSILTNLKIPHSLRITKYNRDSYQHVYVIVPSYKSGYYTIDCVLGEFNYEKPFTAKKDFSMSLNGINVAVLSGAAGEDVMDLIAGIEETELLGAGDEIIRLQGIYDHLVKTRNIIRENPSLISSVDYPPAFIKMLDYAIENWNTPNREKALEVLAKNEEFLNRLNGFDGSDDPELDGLDDAFMGESFTDELLGATTKPKKKGFFAKVGEAVKKGAKVLVRFNPVTISARGGFLLAMKLNVKKMASKLKWGYATKEDAAKKGVNAAQWEKSKKALEKVENLFVDKLQGKKSALKNAILKGKAGGLSGAEEEEIDGLGFAPAAALAAAIPVITSALKIMVDNGVMKKEEADNIQAEVNSKASEADKLANDPDITEAISENPGGSSSAGQAASSANQSGSAQGGIIGFIKEKPLIAIGGAALGIWGLTKLLAKNKSTSGKGFGATPHKHGTHPKRKPGWKKITSITLK